jgi:hypothetical protein
MATPFIDSRFRRPASELMASSVAAVQNQRATIAGPPVPTAPFSMQGVEKQAADALKMRQDQGPMQPMIVNGGMRFAAPAAPAPAPLPAPSAPMMTAAAPAPARPMMMSAPRPSAPVNPLGGMPTTSLSSRGGPMSYSQPGVGTNNPNAYAVGQNRAPVGMRMLERAARRRDPRAIMALASMEQQNAQQGQQMSMMQMREAADAQRFDQQQQNQMTMFELQQQAAQQRDATNFGQQKEIMQMQSQQRAGESALEFQRRQEAEAAQRAAQSIVSGEQLPMTGGSVPMVRRADGTMSMAGGFMPTPKVEAPLTPDEIAAARAMGGDVNIRQGNTQIRLPGMAPANPTRLTPIPGSPSMIQGGAPTPDRVFDPYTGEFYEAGKVPGRGSAAAPAAATTPAASAETVDTKARMNALRKRLGLAEL